MRHANRLGNAEIHMPLSAGDKVSCNSQVLTLWMFLVVETYEEPDLFYAQQAAKDTAPKP